MSALRRSAAAVAASASVSSPKNASAAALRARDVAGLLAILIASPRV